MSTIFIIHGVGGNPEENWFPWLKAQLEKVGHRVIVPQFPTPENQTLEEWMEVMDGYQNDLGPETILVGHSLGPSFILSVLEKYRAKAAFLVAPVFGKIENIFEPTMRSFYQHPFDWEKIKSNCPYFVILHTENDPYLQLDQTEILAGILQAPLHIIPGGGHLNQSAGYRELPLLLEEILKLQ
jgi:predicted alpha/beta hydrolase family esterase